MMPVDLSSFISLSELSCSDILLSFLSKRGETVVGGERLNWLFLSVYLGDLEELLYLLDLGLLVPSCLAGLE